MDDRGNRATGRSLTPQRSSPNPEISALTIDVGRAGLSDSPTLDIAADREVVITFVRDGEVVGRVTVSGSAS